MARRLLSLPSTIFEKKTDGKTLWEKILAAAACNFFQAVYEGELEVSVEDLRPDRDNVASHVLNTQLRWKTSLKKPRMKNTRSS